MEITFTLNPSYSGATYVAGPFNISGTTCEGDTYWLVTGATKTQLLTGLTITTAYTTLTGGTIQSTGTCTNSQEWSTGYVCPYVTLNVYAKDLDPTPANITIYYSVNSGSTVEMVSNSPLSTNCQSIGSITGLSVGDTVNFTNNSTVVMSGVEDTSVCPNNVIGTQVSFQTTIDGVGNDYVALAIDTGDIL